jgi:hypothetical protein
MANFYSLSRSMSTEVVRINDALERIRRYSGKVRLTKDYMETELTEIECSIYALRQELKHNW